MKTFHTMIAVSLSLTMSLSAQDKIDPKISEFDDRDWPQAYETSDGLEIAIFQPQIYDWTDCRKMTARAAVAVKPKGGKEDQITYGAITMTADTAVD